MDINTIIQLVIQYGSIFLGIVGGIAVIVGIITEITKNTKYLDKIPTELEVLVLSVGFTIVALFVYGSVMNVAILWYYVVGAVLLGLVSSYVSMFGWEKLIEIKDKFAVPKELREIYKLTYKEKSLLESEKVNDPDAVGVLKNKNEI